MRTSCLAAALMLAAALAGCNADDGEPDARGVQPQGGFLSAAPTPTHGAMTGVILDLAVRPVPGAAVRLAQTGDATESDEEGRFRFERLPAGLYHVEVGAPSFYGARQSVEVVAGATATVKVVLEPDLTPTPYHETYQFRGRISLHATIAWQQLEWMAENYLGTNSPLCECSFRIETEEAPDAHVLEMLWEDSVAKPTGPTEWYWNYYADDPYVQQWGYNTSPMHVVFEAEDFDPANRAFTVWVTGDAEWVAIEQDFEVFLTLWYNGPAPPGWSIVASSDGA